MERSTYYKHTYTVHYIQEAARTKFHSITKTQKLSANTRINYWPLHIRTCHWSSVFQLFLRVHHLSLQSADKDVIHTTVSAAASVDINLDNEGKSLEQGKHTQILSTAPVPRSPVKLVS